VAGIGETKYFMRPLTSINGRYFIKMTNKWQIYGKYLTQPFKPTV